MSTKWSSYQLEIYQSRKAPPVLNTVDFHEVEQNAREKMKDHMSAFMYTFGSAGTCATDKANRAAFEKYKIIPTMLRNVTDRSLDTTIMGVKYSSPLFIAPIGVQGILHPDGELATARAAGKLGVPAIMSTASSRSMENFAEANGINGQRWYQLYWPKDDEITISLLHRAKANGFTTLVLTLDTMTLGWRPHDLEKAYIPFGHGVGCAIGLSDPVFMKRYGLGPTHEHPAFPYDPIAINKKIDEGDEKAVQWAVLGTTWIHQTTPGIFRTWEDLAFLREHWDGPIVLKGIQSVKDAEMAVDYVNGIVVSNHGGRQVDGAIGSLDALYKIGLSEKVREAQKSGKFTVMFDSGIRTGSDIIKALALGAQAILLGRPYMYGLCVGGEDGVAATVRGILADLDITMGLCGLKNIEEIVGNRDILDI